MLIQSKNGIFVRKDYSYKGVFKLGLNNNKVFSNTTYVIDSSFFFYSIPD